MGIFCPEFLFIPLVSKWITGTVRISPPSPQFLLCLYFHYFNKSFVTLSSAWTIVVLPSFVDIVQFSALLLSFFPCNPSYSIDSATNQSEHLQPPFRNTTERSVRRSTWCSQETDEETCNIVVSVVSIIIIIASIGLAYACWTRRERRGLEQKSTQRTRRFLQNEEGLFSRFDTHSNQDESSD